MSSEKSVQEARDAGIRQHGRSGQDRTRNPR